MEKNLNVAPTEQELKNAGFEDSHFGLMEFSLGEHTSIVVNIEAGGFRFIGSNEWIKLTKQKINDAFALFNQPLPQWEKPKPKVGEVWQSDINTIVITPTNSSTIVNVFYIASSYDNYLWSGTFTSTTDLKYAGYKKVADTLEDYYKEKFLRESVTAMLYEAKEETTETATLGKNLKPQTVIDTIEEMNKEIFKPTTIDPRSQVETAHEYSYKGLKADGKIPHDRSGEDHDSIEALKKLLAICEALNGIFRDSGMYLYNPYWDKQKQELFYITNERQDESPIYFTSEEAFDAFKSEPKNVELFKTFLKIK